MAQLYRKKGTDVQDTCAKTSITSMEMGLQITGMFISDKMVFMRKRSAHLQEDKVEVPSCFLKHGY